MLAAHDVVDAADRVDLENLTAWTVTIKVNLLDPNARDALRALLSVLDQKDEAAPKGKPAAALRNL